MPDPADVLAAYGGEYPSYPDPSGGTIAPADVLRAFGHVLAPGWVAPPDLGASVQARTARDYATELSGQKNKPPDPLETMLGVTGGSPAMFIGPAARTWNPLALKAAEQMLAKGADREAVRVATGIDLTAAGQPRTEISDAGSRVLSGAYDARSKPSVALGDVFEHPELYQAYPQLRDMPVRFNDPVFNDPRITVAGGMDLATKPPTLLLNPKELKTPEDMRSTTLHELGHAVQAIEGFPSGGGMGSPEVRAAAMATLQQRRASYETALEGVYNRRDAWVAEQKKANPRAFQRRLEEQYFDQVAPQDADIAREAITEQAKYHRGRMQLEEEFKHYKSLAGEEDARAIQARRDLTSEQLRETPIAYDTPQEQQLVRYNATTRPAQPLPPAARDTLPPSVGTPQGRFNFSAEPKSFTERMAEAQQVAFERAQRGTATGDYGMGTARRTAPDAPRGSFEDLAAREAAKFKADQARIVDEYRVATGQPRRGESQPLLAPGERPEDLQFSGKLPTTETTPIGEQYVLPGAEQKTSAQMAQRKAEAPLRPTVEQKPPGGLFEPPKSQGDFQFDIERLGPSGAVTRGVEGVRDAPYALPAANANIQGMTRVRGPGQPPERIMDESSFRFPSRAEVLSGYTNTTANPLADLPRRGNVTGIRPDVEFQIERLPEDVSGPITGVGRPFIRPENRPLFDYSRLAEVPDRPQFDLPRVVPPEGVPEATQALASPKNLARVNEAVRRGEAMGGREWYNTEPLREQFVNELGEAQGNQAFRQYMDLVAANSPRTRVPENIRNASYFYGTERRGEDLPRTYFREGYHRMTKETQAPTPYGIMPIHVQNMQNLREGGLPVMQNPKPASFVENLTGNQTPVTIDTHNMRAITAGREAEVPNPNQYGFLERMQQAEAAKMGMSPAQYQASMWVGAGKETGLGSPTDPFLRVFEDRVRKTAEATGKTPAQVLREFIRAQAPLLSVTPAAVLLGAGQDQPAP
jgi:hypothetical protein